MENEEPALLALATHYAGQGGALWVAGDVDGMIATKPLSDGAWEICRVYVHPDRHGSGLAHHLLDLAEHHAITAGARRLDLWTDTRFDRAHRFYAKRGYVRGARRSLHDLSNTDEWFYFRVVS